MKTFMIKFPDELHLLAKIQAVKQKITLHDFIIIAIEKEAARGNNEPRKLH